MSDLVHFSVNDKGTAFVTLNRPDKKDALDIPMILELTRIFQEIKRNPDIQRVVLGSGKNQAFCAGMDVNDLVNVMTFDLSPDEKFMVNQGASEGFARMFDAIADRGNKPMIGVVKGLAIGAGATLVSLCDYVVASHNATFAYPETKMNLKPSVSAPYVVARIGEDNAINHFSSGEPFLVEEAKRMHMVDKIVHADDIEAEGKRIVEAAEKGEMEFKPKPLPEQIATKTPDPKMVKLVIGARMLYADRTEQGRERLIRETTLDFTHDRVNPATIAKALGYRIRVTTTPKPGMIKE